MIGMSSMTRRVDPDDREPGEIEVLVRCGHCNRVVGNLWGRPRSVVGGSVRTYEGSGAAPAAEIDEHEMREPGRRRFHCSNKRCGRAYVVRSEKLVVATLDALDRSERDERVVTLPRDVEGDLDMSAPTVNEWRFVGR